MSAPVYEIRNLCKVYRHGHAANDGISLDVMAGEILGLLGPNGAGKSTLVKQMVAHLRPTSGSISLYGKDVPSHATMVARLVGYYSQEPHAMSALTVEEAILFTGRLRGLSLAEARQQTEHWLERLDLTGVAQKQLKRISGGQRRMVGLATTIIGNPPVFIFDEPTNELDPTNRKLVWDVIREQNRDLGATVVLVTHNVFEAERVVDRIGVVQKGKLVALDTVGQLKKRVDQRLKIEFSIRIGQRAQAEALLRQWGPVEAIGENRLRMLAKPDESSRYLQQISVHMDELACEEYRVIPPSLEDVYLYFGGREEAVNG